MFEELDSSVLSETVKTAFFNILLELVPYTYSIGLEGTVGITIDNRQMMFLHFSDSVNKSAEDDDAVGSAVRSSPQPVKKKPVFKRCVLGDEMKKVSVPGSHDKALSNCTNVGKSLLLSKVHPSQSAFSAGNVLVNTKIDDEAELGYSDLPLENSIAACRKGFRAKLPDEGVTVFRNVNRNRVSSVCPATGEEEIEVSPQTAESSYVGGGDEMLEVLDFSTHSKMEFFKEDAPGFKVPGNENPNRSRFPIGCFDDEIENVPTRASARNLPDQTLLRQLLLNNAKTKKAKSGKRRLSASDDESKKKNCVSLSSSVAEKLKSGSSSLLARESGPCVVGGATWTTPSHRSTTSKKTEVKSTDDSGGERRANPDSILCRLLTCGINMYDTTEVERLRQVSSAQEKLSDVPIVGRNVATSSQLGDAIVDLVLTNIKTEREPYLRMDEFVNMTPVKPTEDDVRRRVSNSPTIPLGQSGFGSLRSLADAAVTVQPQLQTDFDVAEHRLAVVKQERGDSVDIRRTLQVSAGGTMFPSDTRPMENLYQTYYAKSSDFFGN